MYDIDIDYDAEQGSVTHSTPSPDFTAMQLDFAERVEGQDTRFTVMLAGDKEAGDLRTVLAAVRNFLRAAGFTYVNAVAAETDAGTVIFSDEA